MKTIVITGSTRGIGFGLADAFLARGCRVTVSGRSQASVDEAAGKLAARHGAERVFGYPCDVTDFEAVQGLWDASKAHWGKVDIWINNAGIAHAQTDLREQAPEEMAAVVETNVVGSLFGAKVALTGMLEQGSGSLYNLEGLGSDGRKIEGLTVYGTTKHAVKYLTDALVKEVEGTPVLVGALRPGMVITEMLTQQYKDRPVRVVGISCNERKHADPAAYFRRNGYTYTLLLNGGDVARAYNLWGFPTIYVIDPEGKVAYAAPGGFASGLLPGIIENLIPTERTASIESGP